MPLPQQHRYRVLLTVLVIAAGLLVSLWLGGRYAEQRAWDERSVEARGQLQLYAQSIRTLVERFSSVPEVLALDSDIRSLLRAPHDRQLRLALNQRLERLNAAAGSTVLYLLDAQGETLVASNWRDWSSFVGNNYAFRPYFQNALREGGARYFAVGVTTGIPGYFLSHVVRDEDGSLIGVLVVKLELEELQREWVDQPGVLLVADSHQVAILSNRPAWRFRTLQALDDQARAELIDVRKYAEQALKPLPSRVHRYIDDETAWTRMDGPDGARDYLWQRMTLPDEGWTLHLLSDPGNLADARLSYRLAAAGVWMTFAFLLLFLAQRRKNQRLQAGIRERLEREVALRTAELRQAQEGLVHAAKMAALGQMSAALAHEINQPLMAIANYALAARRRSAALAQADKVVELLDKLIAQTTRAGDVIGRLRGMVKRNEIQAAPVQLERLVDDCIDMVRMECELRDIRLERRGGGPLPMLVADGIQLQQVVLNLLRNAIEAMDGMAADAPRQITIEVGRAGERELRVQVADLGPGIAGDDLERIFDAFYSTKVTGLGIGLSLCRKLIEAHGGRLGARSRPEGGAVFEFTLPLADAGGPDGT